MSETQIEESETFFGSGGRAGRPSPSDSATLYDENYIKQGNDGNLWRIAVASNGVQRWQKLSDNDQHSYREGDYYGASKLRMTERGIENTFVTPEPKSYAPPVKEAKKHTNFAETMPMKKADKVITDESITPLPKEVAVLMADIPKDALEYNLTCRKIIDFYKTAFPNFPYKQDEKGITVTVDVPADVLNFLSGYTGMGGLKFSPSPDESKTIMYEYYTPDKIIERMWGLAYKYGYTDKGSVLEPAVATGRFLKYAPEGVRVLATEVNFYSYCIAVLLYGRKAEIRYQHFEQFFIKNNLSIKGKIADVEKFDLVIGNPPYGRFQSFYSDMGERTYTKAKGQVEYFILRGLDMLKPNGLLIYIIGTEVALGGKPFLDSPMNPTKEMISERGELIDAYRLPNGVFDTSDVLCDLVVFKKK